MEVFRSTLVRKLVELSLEEDLPAGDITSLLTIPETARSEAQIVARQELIVCGLPLIPVLIDMAELDLKAEIFSEEGQAVEAGERLAGLRGSVRDLLALERTMLNFLQKMSGIATHVRAITDVCQELQVLDTRKTTPGWRVLEKYAVLSGGGKNHRMSLSDMILIKDNHIATAGSSISKTLEQVKESRPPYMQIEIEVDTLDQLEEVLKVGADIVMLDNFTNEQITEALQMLAHADHKPLIEVSGGLTSERLRELASLGVKRVSMGALTTQARFVDIALDISEPAT